MNIVVNGLLTHYERAGKGKLVLLLHGWGDNSAGLRALQTALAKHYDVIALDLPGFGATQPPAEAWDLDNYAEFVQQFLRKLQLKQPYAVIGHSNGGALAIRATALGALVPQKLVLLAASGIRGGRSGKRMVLQLIAKIGNVATLALPEQYRRALRKSLYAAAGSDALVVPQLQETFRRTVRQDVQADAAALQVPTLLIFGRSDTAVPLQHGETYARLIQNAQLSVVDAGHFVHLDQSAQVTQQITEFLA